MQTIELYRYIREDSGVTVSVTKPDSDYTTTYRLIADEGFILANGETLTYCIDTDTPSYWTEAEDDTPIEEPSN
jgi:hypothetical protein